MNQTTSSDYVVLPANHWLFQIANALLLVSYSTSSVLWLRVFLASAATAFTLWGILVLRISVDTVVWNALFLVINTGHFAKIMYDRRPVYLDPEKELILTHVFGYFNIDRGFYKNMTDKCTIFTKEAGEYYKREGDLVDCLSILLSGEIEVFSKHKKVGTTKSMEFIDSPEWIFKHSHFIVDIKVSKDAKIMSWPYSIMRDLEKNPNVGLYFSAAVAKDSTAKLLRICSLEEQEDMKHKNQMNARFQTPQLNQKLSSDDIIRTKSIDDVELCTPDVIIDDSSSSDPPYENSSG